MFNNKFCHVKFLPAFPNIPNHDHKPCYYYTISFCMYISVRSANNGIETGLQYTHKINVGGTEIRNLVSLLDF